MTSIRFRQLPWAIAFALLVLGFMLSTQFKVHEQAALKEVASIQRAEELAQQLQQAEKERNALMNEVTDLRSKVRNLANSQTDFKSLASQLEQAQVHAGLVALTGPGLTIVMTDSPLPVTPGENANNFIIHDEDVLRMVNELAAAGAEALSINGQRLTSRSEIRCSGPTITINGVRTAPPIEITALGDPAVLEPAITMRNGVAEGLRQWGIGISVKRESKVVVPAYKGSLLLQYGKPIEKEVANP